MASVPDRAQSPNRVIKLKHETVIKRPDAKVGFSQEKEILHHDGAHVTGPTKLTSFSGMGKASELGKIFAAMRESGYAKKPDTPNE